MRFVYSLLMYLISPYLVLRLFWKGRILPAYRERIAERFCLDSLKKQSFDVWVHAVSLGEVIAATPLIEALLKNQKTVLITTMTPTGAAQVKMKFAAQVTHRYVPYDLYHSVQRFFHYFKPKVGVIMETELWPNLIAEANNAHIPLFLANARLSERSLRGYMRFKFFFKPLLKQLNAIFTQSAEDAERFILLGAEPDHVKALGNMKFDLTVHDIDTPTFDAIKTLWGKQRPVVLIASTHDDEERSILKQLKRLQHALPRVILLIAPRHPERFQNVYNLSVAEGFNTALRSQLENLNERNEVVVLDCLGELLGFYHLCDYAFVGGSLVPIGGHNVLEPIAMKVPVFSGNHVHNFKAVCRDLVAAKAIIMVNSAAELVDALISLSKDEQEKQAMLARATQVLDLNKGAVNKYLTMIQNV